MGSSLNRRHVPEEDRWVIWCMPNVYGIDDDISITGFEEQGKEYNETLEKVSGCAEMWI